jgi:hypothetical protein
LEMFGEMFKGRCLEMFGALENHGFQPCQWSWPRHTQVFTLADRFLLPRLARLCEACKKRCETPMQPMPETQFTYGYGSIPINTIFSGMNIHLPAILMWTTGVQGFDTLPYVNIIKI